jgi:hypothetical protein
MDPHYHSFAANMNFSDILSYASKLSKYTSAPPNFNMMKDMKVDFEKPYPDEERMRRGILYWQHVPPEQQAQETCKWRRFGDVQLTMYLIPGFFFVQSKALKAKAVRMKKDKMMLWARLQLVLKIYTTKHSGNWTLIQIFLRNIYIPQYSFLKHTCNLRILTLHLTIYLITNLINRQSGQSATTIHFPTTEVIRSIPYSPSCYELEYFQTSSSRLNYESLIL